MNSGNPAVLSIPRPGTPTIDALQEALHALSRICWRVETVDATVRYADGAEVANQVGIVAYRTRHDPFRWMLGFSGALLRSPVPGARMSGKFSLGVGKDSRPGEFAHGELWTWDVPLQGIEVEGFSLAGTIDNTVKFSMHDDGSVSGDMQAAAEKLILKSARLAAPENLGDYSVRAAFEITDGRYAITRIVLRRVNTAVLSGATVLDAPNSDNPLLGVHLGGFHFDAAEVKQRLLSVRHLPTDLVDMLHRLGPGKVTVGDATLSAALDEIKTAPLDTIRKNLVVSGTVEGIGFTIPAETKLPPVTDLSAQLRYSKGLLTIAQGTAKFGNSTVHDLSASASLGNGIEGADYKTSVGVDADLAELFPAIARSLELYQLQQRDRLEHLSGRVQLVATASGKLSVKTPVPPKNYQVRADAIGAVLAIKGSPGPLKVSRGTVIIDPASIKFDNVMLAATGGNATLDGTVNFAKQGVNVHDVTLGLHDFPSDAVVDATRRSVRLQRDRPDWRQGGGQWQSHRARRSDARRQADAGQRRCEIQLPARADFGPGRDAHDASQAGHPRDARLEAREPGHQFPRHRRRLHSSHDSDRRHRAAARSRGDEVCADAVVARHAADQFSDPMQRSHRSARRKSCRFSDDQSQNRFHPQPGRRLAHLQHGRHRLSRSDET